MENGKKSRVKQLEEKMEELEKEEVAWVLDNPSYEELVERTKDFESFYNEEYPHSALGYKNPRKVFKESVSFHKTA